MTLSEADKALKNNQFVLIQPSKIKSQIYLKKHKSVMVPENAKCGEESYIPEYTLGEIKILKTLASEDDRTHFLNILNDVKSTFEDAYLVFNSPHMRR